MKTALLIDGDIIAYKHAAGSEVPTDWGGDLWTLHTDVAQARHQMEIDLKDLVTILKADEIVIALSDKENFRRRIDETYKASRKKSRKPIGLPSLRDWLEVEWDAEMRAELEADDLLGIWATDPEFLKGYRKIIVSTDKDMKTIPCNLYNPQKPDLGVQKITPESADRFHLYQTLIGENGVRLSGGEKQRLSIARAFLKNSKIILLDEATSSLDSETEEKIQKALDKLTLNKTTVVIAHRLSTILNSDKIYVMDRGTIIDHGNHEELLRNCDIYKNYYNKQINKS